MVRLLLRYPGAPAISRVLIGRGVRKRLGAAVRRSLAPTRALVISDRNVAPLYARAAARSLRRAGIASRLLTLPAGERAKNPATLERTWTALADAEVGRRDVVVAVGGGVVGDLAGFAAATWLRGVAWVCVPTTVLSQVDSSIGGKTAVDLPRGKNLVGAFHQPAWVLVDPATLETLPARERRAGLAEVVKMGMAVDARLFAWLERRAEALVAGNPAPLGEAIARGLKAKARVVRTDERERENGRRTALNYGHTLAHALEAVLGYGRMRHGEAVALGMRVAAALSVREAGLPERERARLDALLDQLRFPRRLPRVSARALLRAMRSDKKRAQQVRWVLTPQMGRASVPRPMDDRLVRTVLMRFGAQA